MSISGIEVSFLKQARSLRGGSRLDYAVSPVPGWAWILFLLCIGWGLTTVNPIVTVFSLLLLPIFGIFLWRPDEPPILAFACGMQWLQAATFIFTWNLCELPLESGGPEFEQAVWLSLVGVLTLGMGMRAGLVRMRHACNRKVESELRDLSPARLFVLFLVFYCACKGIEFVSVRAPAINQPLGALTGLAWIPAFLLIWAVFKQGAGYPYLVFTVALELFSGMIGFFSGFKSIFFVLIILLFTGRNSMTVPRLAFLAIIVSCLVVFVATWSSIRTDYRDFLNQGSGEQVVLEPVGKRVEKLVELVQGVNAESFREGFENSMSRLSYVTFFGCCIEKVPATLPFENGALWRGAIVHILTPRLFFPNKPAISDSSRTQKYAGINVAGEDQGTSIGIGYMAESYVDFGPYWMFAPIFTLGMIYALTYRAFAFFGEHKVLGFSVGTVLLMFNAFSIETSNIKLIGSMGINLLIQGVLFWKFGGAFMRMAKTKGSHSGLKASQRRVRARSLQRR